MKTDKAQPMLRRLVSHSAPPSLCAAILALAPAIGWSQSAQPTGKNSAPVIGAAAIAFDLKSLDGKSVGLESFRGKPLMMNFFANWCDPCRDEMPLINELAAKAGKDGYKVLGIAVEDTRAAVMQYAQEAQLVFPLVLDVNSHVKRSYRIFGPPATFFIDAHGVIRDIVLGPMSPERAHEGLKKLARRCNRARFSDEHRIERTPGDEICFVVK
ncbi:MAG TPA: TlpA disulfide reductase family protein [Candidatus Udaeobacter sp.]|nr:TlpA disulfide reductase family protein [Candidatus Udaeobacter sp.]